MRRLLNGLVAVALCAAVTSCGTRPSASAACSTRARPAGPAAGIMFGVNPDWGHQTLQSYAQALGHAPASAVSFTDLPMSDNDRTNVLAAADQVRAQGAVLVLTLEPRQGLAAVTPDVLERLTADLTTINRSGVPVIVRFAHEMNGSWYAWGEQPLEYVSAFRKVAAAVHAAPAASMMWAPNYGGGYPFAGGQYEARPGTADFAALDTDHDGALTGSDDPYAPYYPGDASVDWVGMSLYHWGSHYPWGVNVLPEPGKLAAQLTGTYHGAGGDDRAVPDFYRGYAAGHHKPLALAETAALVNTSRDHRQGLAIKQAWWSQVFAADLPARFPELKMINWFEWDKYETEIKANVDWTATRDPAERAAFTAALPNWLAFGEPQSRCS